MTPSSPKLQGRATTSSRFRTRRSRAPRCGSVPVARWLGSGSKPCEDRSALAAAAGGAWRAISTPRDLWHPHGI
eukprot:scaffold54086_cov27-Tisochrysis_lutea.AAC.1